MALVATKGRRFNIEVALWGPVTVQTGTLAWDSSYPSGGEAIATWDTANILAIHIPPSGAYTFHYDPIAKKVVAWTSGSEVGNLTNLSALTAVPFWIIMTGHQGPF